MKKSDPAGCLEILEQLKIFDTNLDREMKLIEKSTSCIYRVSRTLGTIYRNIIQSKNALYFLILLYKPERYRVL